MSLCESSGIKDQNIERATPSLPTKITNLSPEVIQSKVGKFERIRSVLRGWLLARQSREKRATRTIESATKDSHVLIMQTNGTIKFRPF